MIQMCILRHGFRNLISITDWRDLGLGIVQPNLVHSDFKKRHPFCGPCSGAWVAKFAIGFWKIERWFLETKYWKSMCSFRDRHGVLRNPLRDNEIENTRLRRQASGGFFSKKNMLIRITKNDHRLLGQMWLVHTDYTRFRGVVTLF